MIRFIGVVLLGLFLLTCEQENDDGSDVECFRLPAGTHLPRLSGLDTTLQLSFVHSLNDSYSGPIPPRHRLNVSWWDKDEGWSEEIKLSEGNDWFINWADFPSFLFYANSQDSVHVFGHWLQYSGRGTYDYDIMFLSTEFSPYGIKLHKDTVSAEHGFLSSAQLPSGGLQLTWLDGRYTKQDMGAAAGTETVEEHGHSGGGAMTLRTKTLYDSTSVELDHRVCDCCNTATVATDSLIMVAYRDRSEHEIRDIAYVIKPNRGEWSTPKLVHADNWEISGCPVNGPALAANGNGDIAIVWYTAANDDARIQFARYDAANDRFTSPTLLDDENPLGRVDIQLADDGTAYVTGLTATENPDSAALTLWTIDMPGSVKREQLAITYAARSSGFPKVALFEDKLYWVRTVVGQKKEESFVEVCWR